MSRTNAPPRLCAIKGWFGIRAFIEADEHVRTVEADRRLAALRVSSSRPRRFGRRVNAGLGDLLPRQNDAEEEPGEALKRGARDGRFGRGSWRAGFLSLPKPEAPGPRREKSARMPRRGARPRMRESASRCKPRETPRAPGKLFMTENAVSVYVRF